MSKAVIQPARTNYFFKQSYVDLKNILALAWKKNFAKAKEHKEKIADGFSLNGFVKGLFIAIFNIFAMLAMFIFGTVMCSILSMMHISVLMLFTFFVYSIALILRLFETIYIQMHQIFGACPHCKNHYKIPVYMCSCGAEHTYLVPGKYGIIKRTCNCGNKLPTSILLGRSKLSAKCPVCTRRLDNSAGEQEVKSICVPVIGGTSVGKTTYITAIIKELFTEVAPKSGVSLQYFDANNQATCTNMVSLYDSGVAQIKTSDLNPSAYNIFVRSPKSKVTRLIYLYDIAGEAFSTTNALATQRQYEYSKGFIFLIDPLAIPRIRRQFEGTPEYQKHAASDKDINDIFDSFMSNLAKLSGLSPSQLSKKSCAVVINKIDAFDLSEQLGEGAIISQQNQNPGKEFGELMDMTVREFLTSHGMTNFVKNVDTRFKEVRFFAVSSLGHSPDGTKFKSSMVMAPFEWIVSGSDSVMGDMFRDYNKAIK